MTTDPTPQADATPSKTAADRPDRAKRAVKVAMQHTSPSQIVATGRSWIRLIRLRALAWVCGIGLAAVAAIAFVGLNTIPVVGAALAAAAVSVHKVSARLDRPTCLGCGHDLEGQPISEHGVICPECGSISPGFAHEHRRPEIV